jgi:ATP-dependent Clp protease ATP-binding subunit ClpC
MISRLTEKAKTAILNVSTAKNPSAPRAEAVLGSIRDSGGVAGYIIQSNPGIKVNSKRKVDLNALVEKAYFHSASFQHMYVGTEHLLLALLEMIGSPNTDEVKKQIGALNTFPNITVASDLSKTPLTDSFGVNLSKSFARFMLSGPVHREEVDLLISVLLQKENPNPLIVGNKGVGKHSLVELLVHRINSMDVPIALAGYQVVELDVMAFVANMSGREGIELGITTFLEELDSMGDVILYIKDLQSMFVGTSTGFAIPLVFSMLRSYLASAGIKMIGIMNGSFYDRISAENTQILDVFEEIRVEEPSEDKVKEILEVKSEELSRYHNVKIIPEMIDYAFNTAKNNIKDTKFPQKAVSLLDQACSRLLLKKDEVPIRYKSLVEKKVRLSREVLDKLEDGNFSAAVKAKKKLAALDLQLDSARRSLLLGTRLLLTKEEIDDSLEDLGVTRIEDGSVDLEHLGKLSDRIKEKIIGQDEVVNTVSRALVRSKLGLRPRKRPMGNFLFLGPTGVGKTELAKVLAETAFGENGLIRLDMSDFSEKHTVARLVGAPPGYVGYGEGGELTTKIELRPDSVVLFDEIEKAHPDVLNILLQIMEEGELVDAKGQTFDFSQAVVILTSNLGTSIVLGEGIGFAGEDKSDEKVEGRLKTNLRKIMKPELLNRFDEVVVFKQLTKKDQLEVLNLLLDEVNETLKAQKITLKIYSSAKKHLLEKGYSTKHGARALRRTMETILLDKIAEFLLKNPKRPLKIGAKFVGNSLKIIPSPTLQN